MVNPDEGSRQEGDWTPEKEKIEALRDAFLREYGEAFDERATAMEQYQEFLRNNGLKKEAIAQEMADWDELFPEPTPEKKAKIDNELGPDFAKRIRDAAKNRGGNPGDQPH